ncbi:hypothetical protein GCM10010837_24080 [Aminobacter niigataensis]
MILPQQLSPQQKRGLRLIHDHRLYRRLNGYGKAPAGVSLDVVNSLRGLGLIRIDITGRQPCPVLTGQGKNLHIVMQARAERRRA